MYNIKCINAISNTGLDLLTDNYQQVEELNDANAILVRSSSLHETELPPTLQAIARAGAGVNNIPVEKCAEQGIVVFNTPGANANGVKEIVIASLLMASRDLIGGINWVASEKNNPELAALVEKKKKLFAGTEIKGRKLGVIGLGSTGRLIANAAIKLEMDVYGFDPFISVDQAWKLSKFIKHAQTLEQIFRECDYITVHVPLTDQTKGMFNKDTFAIMKDGVNILNFSRDTLVVDDDMIEALQTKKVGCYITDFPNPKITPVEGVISVPHLGASTSESEENCAMMAVQQVMDYLENGNIKNSVNFPNCDMGICQQAGRIAIINKNIPNMLGQFTSVLANQNINISDLTNKSKGQWAYTMIDIESPTSPELVKMLEKIEGVKRVRVIK